MNIAIVTGASSGMGREFVRQLSGYVSVDEIWVIARRENALEYLRKEVSVPIRPIPLDLCESSAFDAVAAALEAENACLSLKDLAVNGSDLMQLGLEGKQIGQTLNFLLEQVLDESLPNDRTILLAAAKDLKDT